jgi:hypothetical protein
MRRYLETGTELGATVVEAVTYVLRRARSIAEEVDVGFVLGESVRGSDAAGLSDEGGGSGWGDGRDDGDGLEGETECEEGEELHGDGLRGLWKN